MTDKKDYLIYKLADRMKALDWLANHMDMATEEQRARVMKLQAETARRAAASRRCAKQDWRCLKCVTRRHGDVSHPARRYVSR